METTLCPRSDLPPEQCAHCRPKPDYEPPPIGQPRLRKNPTITEDEVEAAGAAVTACRCYGCQRTIRFGEQLYRFILTGEPVCKNCGEAAA